MTGGRRRRGFSLIELLVAITITMMMVAAIARFFKFVGDSVAEGRAAVQLNAELHGLRLQLHEQLALATPYAIGGGDASSSSGYLEIIEGPTRDGTAASANIADSLFGDVDDVIAFTVRSRGEPFRGRIYYRFREPGAASNNWRTTYHWIHPTNPAEPIHVDTVESNTAEIVYWVTLDDKNGNGTRDYGEYYVLRRRILVVRPDIELGPTYQNFSAPFGNPALPSIFNVADLSLRREGMVWKTNNLETLSRRENRFGRNENPDGTVNAGAMGPAPGPPAYPAMMMQPASLPRQQNLPALDVYRLGDDVVLWNVVAFDVQVFDPRLPLRVIGGTYAVEPHEAGYASGGITGQMMGAFGDLGHGINTPASHFGSAGRLAVGGRSIFDSWTASYDRDGIDQLGDGQVDTGSNGLDDDNDGSIDEQDEIEVRPPYDAALRGVRILIRTYDPDMRQVAETSVTVDFTPF